MLSSQAKQELIDLVEQLVNCENRGDEEARNKAMGILAGEDQSKGGFFGIVRRSGAKQHLPALLEQIANPPDPNPKRAMDKSKAEAWIYGDLGMVRSDVTTRDPKTNVTKGPYRNLHVFVRQHGAWRCVAWQVTEAENKG